MAPKEPKAPKPKLTKLLLERQGIYFYENVHTSDDLPEWLRPIRRHILRFRGMLPRKGKNNTSKEKDFKKELKYYHKQNPSRTQESLANWSLQPSDHEGDSIWMPEKRHGEERPRRRIIEELVRCEQIQNEVVKLCNVEEIVWTELLATNIFQEFRHVYHDAGAHEELYSRWALHRDLSWNEFYHEDMGSRSPERTGPKPDVTYAFPIIDIPTVAPDDQHDLQVRGFSLEVLSHLCRHNHKVAPTKGLRRYTNGKTANIKPYHQNCFPWAVVEVKPDDVIRSVETFCYCQAANASATAHAMREELMEYLDKDTEEQEALVIFSFTCIGPDVKFWLTYRETGYCGNIVMRCIWATSLELTWGVLMLRMIVKNMGKWVYHRVKGDLAKWTLQAYQKSSTPNILSPSGDVMEQRTRPASSCGPAPSTPMRPTLFSAPQSAPAQLNRRSYQRFQPSPSRCTRDRYVIDDFIDDTGVDDLDWDEGYLTDSSDDDSSSSTDTDNNSNAESDSEDESEVQDLVKEAKTWFPDIDVQPDMTQIYVQDATSASETSSEEEDNTDSDEDDDSGYFDDTYFVDGQRAGDFLVRGKLQK